jgi:hypothetical protein
MGRGGRTNLKINLKEQATHSKKMYLPTELDVREGEQAKVNFLAQKLKTDKHTKCSDL